MSIGTQKEIQNLTRLCRTYQREAEQKNETIRKLKIEKEELKNQAAYYKNKIGRTSNKKYRQRISKNKRKQVYERDNYSCQICGSTQDLTIDHFIPLSKGGTNDKENLWTLCNKCNNEKGDQIYRNIQK